MHGKVTDDKEARETTRPKIDQTAFKAGKEVAREEPKLLQEENSLQEAGEKIRSLNTNRLPVASGDRLVGAVEGKYPERTAACFGHDPKTAIVREIMLKKPYFCLENQSLDEAREIMCDHHLDYLPVVDGNMRVVGIVALRDLPTTETSAPN